MSRWMNEWDKEIKLLGKSALWVINIEQEQKTSLRKMECLTILTPGMLRKWPITGSILRNGTVMRYDTSVAREVSETVCVCKVAVVIRTSYLTSKLLNMTGDRIQWRHSIFLTLFFCSSSIWSYWLTHTRCVERPLPCEYSIFLGGSWVEWREWVKWHPSEWVEGEWVRWAYDMSDIQDTYIHFWVRVHCTHTYTLMLTPIDTDTHEFMTHMTW